MITERGKYYLYRHIRLDKNEPFYIGYGTRTRKQKGYQRAFNISNRSNCWIRIINKTKYEVEILIESNNLQFIKNKEIEFIKLYGRRDLGLGPLVNMTNGGDGTHGTIYTEERRQKIIIANTGRKMKPEQVEKMIKSKLSSNKKRVLQYDLGGKFIREWGSVKEVATYLNITEAPVRNNIYGLSNYCCKSIWKYKESEKYPLNIETSSHVKRIKEWFDRNERLKNGINYNLVKVEFTNLITGETKTFPSIKSCSLETGVRSFYICRLCKSNKIYKSKYKFSYK